MSPAGLYVHIPFCRQKCAYCNFYSIVLEKDPSPFIHALLKELSFYADEFECFDTIYIGGGTPSILPVQSIADILTAVGRNYTILPEPEITVEVNPGDAESAYLESLRLSGVNRINIGIQSFDDRLLRFLGRRHDHRQAGAAIENAIAAGFDNIGLDLIYGVAGASRASFCADVEAAMALAPEHISCYCLEIEAGTPFARRAETGEMAAAADEQRAQYDWARMRLAQAGWNHYEISNFARPGRECRQNLLYWSGGEYLGLGPAAHSHWGGVRWGNTPELPDWKREFEEHLAPEAKARETLVMGLRRIAGWGRDEFRNATGFDYTALRGKEIAELEQQGLLVVEPGRIRLAEEALFVSDSVFAALV